MRGIAWLLAFCLAAFGASAETFPNRPIRAIVPFPAGSATDAMARLVSEHFEKVFGHGLIVENMVGATGVIASRATARAAPDGYTIMFSTNSTHSANAYLYNNPGYDPIADFTPLALLSRAPHVMVVRAEPRFPTFDDFVAFAQANPGKLNFGYGNTGSLAGGAMLNAYAKITTTGVSYRGTPQAAMDLLGGRIDFVVMDVSQTQEHIKVGKLRSLAVTGLRRMETLPDTPTMIELGHPEFVLFSWNGVHAPAGVPPEIVKVLNQAIREAVNTPEGKRFYGALGADIGAMTAAEFGDFVKQELKRWEGIIALTGLSKQ